MRVKLNNNTRWQIKHIILIFFVDEFHSLFWKSFSHLHIRKPEYKFYSWNSRNRFCLFVCLFVFFFLHAKSENNSSSCCIWGWSSNKPIFRDSYNVQSVSICVETEHLRAFTRLEIMIDADAAKVVIGSHLKKMISVKKIWKKNPYFVLNEDKLRVAI